MSGATPERPNGAAGSDGVHRDQSAASESSGADTPVRRSASEEYSPPAPERRVEVENPGGRTTFPQGGLEPNTVYEVSGRGTYYTCLLYTSRCV